MNTLESGTYNDLYAAALEIEALFIIPAAARNISQSMGGFFFYSIIFPTFSCLLGVIIPMEFEIPVPSGGAIIIRPAGTTRCSFIRQRFTYLWPEPR